MGDYQYKGRHSDPGWDRRQRLVGNHVGVELEIQHRRGRNRVLQLIPDPPKGTPRPSTERDGSLHENNGVEIVFPPLTYKRAKHPQGFFAKTLKALATEADDVYFDRCGMHININTADWNRDHVRMFCAIISWVPPQWLTNIGGRRLNPYCEQYRYRHLDYYISDGERGAACIRSNFSRIECRFPAPTLDHNRFKVLMDFLEIVESLARHNYEHAFRGLSLEANMKRVFLEHLDSIKTRKARRVKEVLLNGYNEVRRAA